MSYAEALVLAVVQGVTEFLPVSSSGHLVLLQRWTGAGREVDLLYDVTLHAATMIAVLVYFRQDVIGLLRGVLRRRQAPAGVFGGHERRAAGYIVLANLPTAAVGLVIQQYYLPLLTRPHVVGSMLLATGVILWLGRGAAAHRGIENMQPIEALAIGLLQGVAVIPGISRSGATITGGILLGLEGELAARFSLLMSVPAILGASALQWYVAPSIPASALGPYLAGMLIAAMSGYLAIGVIMRLVRRRRFHRFAFYVWPLGVAAIAWYHLAG